MTRRDAATERQVQAAQPRQSTWLAANAGSGKTRVLTDRVARLLLDGVDPQHILCLTYTKAAASEMQNRLFKRLGEWAMMAEAPLREALEQLGVTGPLDGARLAEARTLFARAIETPGGLKIQTIHSFCAGLLRRFPLEAGVSPQFTEIEDRAAALLRQEIVEDFADGPEVGVVAEMARHLTDEDFEKIALGLSRNRALFTTPLSDAGARALFGLPGDFDWPTLIGEVLLPGDVEGLSRLVPVLATQGGKSDATAAERLSAVTAATPAALRVLEAVCLTGSGAKEPFSAKIGSFPTKALREGPLLDEMAWLEGMMGRVEAARPRRLALVAAERTAALHRFAALFQPEYERRKQQRGWLDFDDLILKARALLTDPGVAAWVLFRLDGGIDHILVDEAQDTSPAQWDVIESLAQEFTSGRGARSDIVRTIFVVGDKKQSIYSFQGADPASFDRMQQEFGRRLSGSGSSLENLTLEYSFRSSEAILRLVDMVFEGEEGAGFPRGALHRAFKSEMPGRVDLWPAVPPAEDGDAGDWTDPVDRPGAHHHTSILAERIAQFIGSSIEQGATIPHDGAMRRVRAGDFLILVQRRSELFSEIIRACKAAGLPIAGADRLKVGAELAVKDLGALLSFLATPEDDLSLAAALKSPLFGWSEQDLFTLAHGRPGYLWQALRDRAAAYPRTLEILNDLRDEADFLRPYELLERVLTRHAGRRNLLARLGPEAEDGINALLSQALGYESTNVPSLTGFVSWMQTDDLEIKRPVAGAADMIRVMTVHGAKGLEAPVVILPDTAPRRPAPGDPIMEAQGHALWRVAADAMPAIMQDARAAEVARSEAERLRLLYVALTRAESWLIVAAAGETEKDPGCWFERVQAAMGEAGALPSVFPGGAGMRLEHGDWDVAPTAPADVASGTPPPFTAVPTTRPDLPPPAPGTLSPSDLGGAKALPGEAGGDPDAAMARGTRLHRLLEALPDLPRADWLGAAQSLLHEMAEADRAALMAEAMGVLDAPALAPLFVPGAMAEVAVSADIGPRRLHGSIDRLIVAEDQILAVDFKSNQVIPDDPTACPEGILRQLGAYALALGQVYPDRRIDTAIVWTRTAALMRFPHDLVTAAALRSPQLDEGAGRS